MYPEKNKYNTNKTQEKYHLPWLFSSCLGALLLSGWLALFLFSHSAPVQADTDINPTLSYQGKVTLDDGTGLESGTPTCIVDGPNNDSCDFRFRIYGQSTGGFALWTETHSNVELGEFDGVFQVQLGSITRFGSLLRSFGRDDLYLEISFDPDGNLDFDEDNNFVEDEIFLPREAISSVPQAFTARQLVGLDDSFILRLPGADGSYENFGIQEWDTGLYFDTTTNQLQIRQDNSSVGFIDFDTGAFGSLDDFYLYNSSTGTYIGLGDQGTSSNTSGASRIGIFDELNNSDATNVQDVLSDLDAAIGLGGLEEGLCAEGYYVIGFDEQGQMICGSGGDPLYQVQQVTSGPSNHGQMCARLAGGEVYCWGENSNYELGIGDNDDRLLPARVPLPHPATQLVRSQQQIWALLDNGEVWGWGVNTQGQLGVGNTTAHTTPQPVVDVSSVALTNAIQLVSSDGLTDLGSACALVDDDGDGAGTVFCWGENQSGQRGRGSVGADGLFAQPIVGLTSVVQLASTNSAGSGHRCALTSNGIVSCWGDNTHGQLGDGTNTTSGTPVTVNLAGNQARQLALAGGEFGTTLAVLDNGTVRTWGDNQSGQLGINSTSNSNVPVSPVLASIAGVAISGQGNNTHACALSSAGEVFCWGENGQGQLGLGDITDRLIPTSIESLSYIQQISLGVDSSSQGNTCAIQQGGKLICWGENGGGQLGTGNTLDSRTPQYVRTLPESFSLGGSSDSSVGGALGDVLEVSQPNAEDEVETSLLAQWKLNEDGVESCSDGNDICDSSGNNHHGDANVANGTTITSGFLARCLLGQDQCQQEGWTTERSLWGPGALIFDGLDDRVEIEDSIPLLSDNDFTVDGWFYVESCTDEQWAVNKGNGIWGLGCNGHQAVARVSPQGEAPLELNGSALLNDEQWHYLALTWNSGVAELYVDGVLADTKTSGGATVMENNTDSITLGQRFYTGCTGNCHAFDGRLDNVRLIDRALSASEVAFLGNIADQQAIYTLDGVVLGIGTTTPTAELEVVGTIRAEELQIDTNWTIGQAGNDLVVENLGIELLRLTEQGNLGIGTTTPSERLSVDGNVAVTGDVLVDGAVRGDNLVSTECPAGQYLVGFNTEGYIECSSEPTVEVASLVNGRFSSGQSCAVLTDGRVACWGSNQSSLGIGAGGDQSLPVFLPFDEIIGEVWLGQENGFALADSGTLYAWGENDQGQLGDGTTQDRWVPEPVLNLSDVTTISISQGQSVCAIEDGNNDGAGQVWCWGDNTSGQLGNATNTDSALPVAVQKFGLGALNNATSLSMSGSWDGASQYASVCAVDANEDVWCWGENKAGQLGLGNTIDLNQAFQATAAGFTNVQKMVSSVGSLPADQGHDFRCAVLSDNTLWCWGYNASGQVTGNNTDGTFITSPIQVAGLANVEQFALAGGNLGTTYAVLADGTVRAWGNNSVGQLGNGNVSSISGLINPGLSNVKKVVTRGANGITTTCAHLLDGKLHCWGANEAGQVGQGSISVNVTSPTEVVGLDRVRKVELFGSQTVSTHACAIDLSGKLRCWGNNGNGQLGTASTGQASIPLEVKTLTQVLRPSDRVVTFEVTNNGSQLVVNGELQPNLTLTRGVRYEFSVNSTGHPLYITGDPAGNGAVAYNYGVENNQLETGTLSFTPNQLTPNTLYYQSFSDASWGAQLTIQDAEQNYWDLSGQNLSYASGDVIVNNGSLCLDDGNGNCPNVGLPGHIYYSVAHAGYADVAEKYPSREELSPGQIVSLTSDESLVVQKSRVVGDRQALGVISTKPGLILGDRDIGLPQYAIALEGRVPVQLILPTSQTVEIGTLLTPSGLPGLATPLPSSGNVVGRTLQSSLDWNQTESCTHLSESEITDLRLQAQAQGKHVVELLTWPEDLNGTNSESPCFILPQTAFTWSEQDFPHLAEAEELIVGKLMMFIQRGFEIQEQDWNELFTENATAVTESPLSEEEQTLLNSLLVSTTISDLLQRQLTLQTLEVSSDAVFNGNITLNGPLIVGQDTAGQVEIPVGDRSVSVTFSQPYLSLPVVSLTAVDFSGEYFLTEVTETGFTILLTEATTDSIAFQWTTFGQD